MVLHHLLNHEPTRQLFRCIIRVDIHLELVLDIVNTKLRVSDLFPVVLYPRHFAFRAAVLKAIVNILKTENMRMTILQWHNNIVFVKTEYNKKQHCFLIINIDTLLKHDLEFFHSERT